MLVALFKGPDGAIGPGLHLQTIELWLQFGPVVQEAVQWVSGVVRSARRGRIRPANQLSPGSESRAILNVQQPLGEPLRLPLQLRKDRSR